MRRILTIASLFLCLSVYAQTTPPAGLLDRFTDPERGRTVFVSKGHRGFGISGAYRSFNVGGEVDGDGYQILSMFNIGNGSLHYWSVSPRYSWFVANDLSLGIRLDYSGYIVDSDLKVDLRTITGSDDPELNLQLMNRHMQNNSFGLSFTTRRYLSFFGSRTFAVFGEARLYGKYGHVRSWPFDTDGQEKENRRRFSTVWGTGLKIGAGLCVRLRDNSAFTVSVPLVGVGYTRTNQVKQQGVGAADNNASISSFGFTRQLEIFAVQVGYVRYMLPKKKR